MKWEQWLILGLMLLALTLLGVAGLLLFAGAVTS